MANLFRRGIRALIRTTSAADNPPSGQRALLAKSDGWYDRDSTGVETKLGAGGTGGSSLVPIQPDDPGGPDGSLWYDSDDESAYQLEPVGSSDLSTSSGQWTKVCEVQFTAAGQHARSSIWVTDASDDYRAKVDFSAWQLAPFPAQYALFDISISNRNYFSASDFVIVLIDNGANPKLVQLWARSSQSGQKLHYFDHGTVTLGNPTFVWNKNTAFQGALPTHVDEAYGADASHLHSASSITSGTLAIARLPTPVVYRVVYNTGTSSYPARPGATYVEWVGPVDPGFAALDGDTWVNTA